MPEGYKVKYIKRKMVQVPPLVLLSNTIAFHREIEQER